MPAPKQLSVEYSCERLPDNDLISVPGILPSFLPIGELPAPASTRDDRSHSPESHTHRHPLVRIASIPGMGRDMALDPEKLPSIQDRIGADSYPMPAG